AIRRRNIQQRNIRLQLLIKLKRPLLIFALILQLQATLKTIEDRRRNHREPIPGIPIRNSAYMGVDAIDLLNHNQRSDRLALGPGNVRAQLMTITCLQLDPIAHVSIIASEAVILSSLLVK